MKNKHNVLLYLLILFLLISILANFYLINNSKKYILTHKYTSNSDSEIILKDNIIDLKSKVKDIEIKQQQIEANISTIMSSMDNYSETIIKLQNQTKDGQNNNIKIIINLLGIMDYSVLGKNFSDILNTVESMTKDNNELHSVILKMYDHRNDSITNSKIIESFSKELNSVENVEKHNKGIKNFIKSNIRLTKTSSNSSITPLDKRFKELINGNEYEEAVYLLNSNKTINSFNNTLELLSKKVELELLLKEAFRVIYNQN